MTFWENNFVYVSMWYEESNSSVACEAKDAKDPVSQLTHIRKSFHGCFKSKYYFTEPTLRYTFELALMSYFLVMKTVSTWHASTQTYHEPFIHVRFIKKGSGKD